MTNLCYHAAYADGCKFLRLCSHQHATVTSAAACMSSSGEYVVAAEDGIIRTLTGPEEVEYEYALFGNELGQPRQAPVRWQPAPFSALQRLEHKPAPSGSELIHRRPSQARIHPAPLPALEGMVFATVPAQPISWVPLPSLARYMPSGANANGIRLPWLITNCCKPLKTILARLKKTVQR